MQAERLAQGHTGSDSRVHVCLTLIPSLDPWRILRLYKCANTALCPRCLPVVVHLQVSQNEGQEKLERREIRTDVPVLVTSDLGKSLR